EGMGNPGVEDILLRGGEHLHRHGRSPGIALLQGFEEIELHPVRCGIVMGFSDIDNAAVSGSGRHLPGGDEVAGAEVEDVTDLWLVWRWIRGLRVAEKSGLRRTGAKEQGCECDPKTF